MALKRRHRIILLAVGIYWPLIFWLTHIPIPDIARQSGMSDKTMHWTAYLVLSFLTWLAWEPYEKVRWNRAAVWVILGVLAGYGALDEWLQGRPFIGRSADWMDWAANLAGIGLGLGILTFLSFWPALLAVSAVFLYVIQNHSHLLTLWPPYHLDIVFHFTAYAAFTLIWLHFLTQRRSIRNVQEIFGGMLVPFLLLGTVETAAWFQSRPSDRFAILTAAFAIVCSLILSLAVLSGRSAADGPESSSSFTPVRRDDRADQPDNRG